MAERNYLKTEAVFLAEKTPKKEVVVTPPLREDSLKVTENGTYQAPIGRGYTDVSVNVAPPVRTVVLTWDADSNCYDADKTNEEIFEILMSGGSIIIEFDMPDYAGWHYASPLAIWGKGYISENVEGYYYQIQLHSPFSSEFIYIHTLSTGNDTTWYLNRDDIEHTDEMVIMLSSYNLTSVKDISSVINSNLFDNILNYSPENMKYRVIFSYSGNSYETSLYCANTTNSEIYFIACEKGAGTLLDSFITCRIWLDNDVTKAKLAIKSFN